MTESEIKNQKEVWQQKLRQSGFQDIEQKHGRLKSINTASAAFKSREQILEFFLLLDCFLVNHDKMPKFDRKVMELYSKGVKTGNIAKQLRIKNIKLVSRLIARYRDIVLTIKRMQEKSQSDPY